jgi:ureidoglycolate hydrolase
MVHPGPRIRSVTAQLVSPKSWQPYGQIPVDETEPEDNTVISFKWGDPHVNFIGHQYDEIQHTERGSFCDLLNRHDTATQTLMPMNMDALVVVAPAEVDFSAAEHIDRIEAFVLRQHQCINLSVGTWHWGPFPTSPGRVQLFNIQGRRFAEDNKVAYLERDLGILIEALLP